MNSDTDRMMHMIFGYWVTQIVHAAATFSFADHLTKGARTAEDIAKAEGTDPSATFRLLRTCASLGMAAYDGKSRFVATPLLETMSLVEYQRLFQTAGLRATNVIPTKTPMTILEAMAA